MMAGMGTTAPLENPGQDELREPPETRQAILAAARRVALRDGVTDMSLAGVAEDAGCEPNAIYAIFSSKDDLLLSVVADDLAALARVMRGDVAPPAPAQLPGPLLLSHSAEPPGASDSAGDSEAQSLSRFPVVQTRRDQTSTVQTDSAELKDTIVRMQDSIARLEARPVDSWLERRLREFERGLEMLQDQNAKREYVQLQIEEGLRGLHQRIDQLGERRNGAAEDTDLPLMLRLEALEKRLPEPWSDFAADGSRLDRRVTALEKLASVDSSTISESPVGESSAEAPKPEEAAEPETSKAPRAAASSVLTGGPSFLAAARRSAQAAAADSDSATRPTPPRKSNPAKLYLAVGSLVLFVAMLAGVGLFLRDNAINAASVLSGMEVSVAPTPHHPVAVSALRAAPDVRQARLRTLAEAGNPAAELLVGLEYLDGDGLPKNAPAALEWLTRAAARGQPVAEYSLGALWADGHGVRADPVQAFQWYGSAALRGNRRAMHSLAVAYAQGLGTTRNLEEAARWFERAATLSAVNSQFDLAVLYERGMGVPQNLSTAYKWYAIAAAQGDRESQARVAALGATLLPADLEAARVAAVSFRPEPVDASANVPPNLSELP
jgi:TPR repeat protein